MKLSWLLTALLTLTCAPWPAAHGGAEQEELLAWVHTLRYQARDHQALAVCDMILAGDPTNTEALTWRGIIRLGLGDYDAAYEDFSGALSHGERSPMALVGRARTHEARRDSLAAQRDAVEASTLCSRAIDDDRADAVTWYARGVARLLQEHVEAQQDFLTAIGLDPKLADAYLEASHIYRARGRLVDARDRLSRAVEMRPEYAVGFLARARVHFELGDPDDALADCDRAIQINPEYARAWHNRGLVNIARGDFGAAVDDLTAAIGVWPSYASAFIYRGQARMSLGAREAAREDFEQALEIDPDGWAGAAAAEMLDELQR